MKKLGNENDKLGNRLAPTVLYVEDEDENWEVVVLRMRNRYRLVRASNAAEACGKVRELGPQLHAVLMDIQLKGSDCDGVQLTRILKGLALPPLPDYARDLSKIDAPIIFVTANGTHYGEKMLLASGGSLVIPKPVDFVRLTLGLNELTLSKRQSSQP